MPNMSVHNEIIAIAENTANEAILQAIYILAQWVHDQGHPELAEKMRAEFIITTPEPDPEQEEQKP